MLSMIWTQAVDTHHTTIQHWSKIPMKMYSHAFCQDKLWYLWPICNGTFGRHTNTRLAIWFWFWVGTKELRRPSLGLYPPSCWQPQHLHDRHVTTRSTNTTMMSICAILRNDISLDSVFFLIRKVGFCWIGRVYVYWQVKWVSSDCSFCSNSGFVNLKLSSIAK